MAEEKTIKDEITEISQMYMRMPRDAQRVIYGMVLGQQLKDLTDDAQKPEEHAVTA